MFEHTADVGLRVRGIDLDDLFTTAAEGLFDFVVANRGAVQCDRWEQVSLASESLKELFLAWLSELIFRCETRHRLYQGFKVHIAPDGLSLAAEIGGEPIDSERHELDHEIKAVTQHGFLLKHDADGWLAEVILDV